MSAQQTGGLSPTSDISQARVTPTGATTARSLRDVAARAVAGVYFNEARPALPSLGVTWNSAYQPSFNPDAYAAQMGATRTIWVSRSTGNDTTGTGSIQAPYKTVAKAWAVIQAGADTCVHVVVRTGGADVLFYRDEFTPAASTLSGKRVYVTPDDASKKIYATTAQTGLSWALSAGQTKTYESTRSSVSSVLDMGLKDTYGIPTGYAFRASIAEVEANPGSWWQNGSTVYVHTLAGTAPVEGTHLVCVNLASFLVYLGASAEVFLRSVFVMGSAGYGAAVYNVDGDYTPTKFVAWNCAFAWAAQAKAVTSNGLSVESIKAVQLYGCIAAYNNGDGFNFHYTRRDPAPGSSRGYYALAVGCVAYENGRSNPISPNINNGYTSHEGAWFIGVGCRAWNCMGPVFSFVNGCAVALFGCVSGQSLHSLPASGQHAAYYFDNISPPAGLSGSAYLEDCIGDDTSWDLSSDGTVPITLYRFVGAKRPISTEAQLTVVA